jgi:hypothetical protein
MQLNENSIKRRLLQKYLLSMFCNIRGSKPKTKK